MNKMDCIKFPNITFNLSLKASPDMAVTLLEIARIFATKVPGKVDADVLQLLWKVRLYMFCYDNFLNLLFV
jgi:hypothetical protein